MLSSEHTGKTHRDGKCLVWAVLTVILRPWRQQACAHIFEVLSRLRLGSENVSDGKIVFIMLIDVGRSILNVDGAILWSGGPGLCKSSKTSQLLSCMHQFLCGPHMTTKFLMPLLPYLDGLELWTRIYPFSLVGIVDISLQQQERN